MALSAPAPRRPMHTRRIVCEGWLREDGLWDIEATLLDTKAYRYEEPERGVRDIGEPVHQMAIRLTVDNAMVIRAIEVGMPAHPYQACLGAQPAFQGLVGKRIGPGWRREVQACVGGVLGCTHLRELLFPMATVAFQTIQGWPVDEPGGSAKRPSKSSSPDDSSRVLDGCKAWARDSEMVLRFHPHLARRTTG